jgi:hypothetical protein
MTDQPNVDWNAGTVMHDTNDSTFCMAHEGVET